jgi:hypothetical protein
MSFSALGAGIKFDKTKFRKDIEQFEKPEKGSLLDYFRLFRFAFLHSTHAQ